MKPYQEISQCRICGGSDLVPVLSLGNQALTGVFPRSRDEAVTSGPMDLVKCAESDGGTTCGLVQLRQSYSLTEMYGSHYGYHSDLNASMVRHLHDWVERILADVPLKTGDLVLDIGSNDGTLLKAYPLGGPLAVGIDPTGEQFRKHYPPHVQLIPAFFSSALVRKHFGARKAKIVTSISMFYDLEKPLDFAREVREILDDDGVWALEQSYLPTMIERNAYDTVCQEHLEYYRVRQIQWIMDRADMKIVNLGLNDVNGGSFWIMASPKGSARSECSQLLADFLSKEGPYSAPAPYAAFRDNVFRHRDELTSLLRRAKGDGIEVLGYGASTKGNVILQFCGLTEMDIPCIGEVNPDKFGCFTPGTLIPIIPEAEAKSRKPGAFLVLPWHFRDFILKKETDYRRSGGKLLFPLPSPEVL
ncbi:MAG: class I SAM-dependent methyltransferase [Elusimicrobiota bacterium]